jgi:hypothetical protein
MSRRRRCLCRNSVFRKPGTAYKTEEKLMKIFAAFSQHRDSIGRVNEFVLTYLVTYRSSSKELDMNIVMLNAEKSDLSRLVLRCQPFEFPINGRCPSNSRTRFLDSIGKWCDNKIYVCPSDLLNRCNDVVVCHSLDNCTFASAQYLWQSFLLILRTRDSKTGHSRQVSVKKLQKLGSIKVDRTGDFRRICHKVSSMQLSCNDVDRKGLIESGADEWH